MAMPLEFEVPGDDANPPLVVHSLKPGHPEDDLWITLDPDTIMHIIRFIRKSICVEDLTQRRAYASESQPGLWHNGSAGLVRKLRKLDDDDDGLEISKRFKSMNNDGSHQPLQDVIDGHGVAYDTDEDLSVKQLADVAGA